MLGEDCGRTAEGVVVADQHHSTPTAILARALTRSADRAAVELPAATNRVRIVG
jgi:hypothetical protein